MASVADLCAPEALRALATPATLRLGREIVEDGGVELIEFAPLLVRGHVGKGGRSGQRRTTDLRSTDGRLGWTCTCSSDPELFCKHCAALALVTWERAPKRRVGK